MIDYFIAVSRGFRLADVFDITIISILIYVILIWFRKTTSRLVIIGISIIGLTYILARLFQLYLTVYVLQGFFAIFIIAMVIIFQEDIRRFFEQVATWRFIQKKRSSASSHKEIDMLDKVITKLAVKRFGALIILKGNDHLDRHLEGGTLLDGNLSDAILESIFDPHSIGHDGAVLIDNNRAVKFGCHLPLSLNTGKIGNLGLRHTAALGLAELSDALCIVVSEERGTISIAKDGQIERLESHEQLITALEQFYQKRYPGKKVKTWEAWLKKNSREKAVAIILGCGLWLAFGFQTDIVRGDFVVPIEYRNLASNWIIEEPKPKEATVTLTGSAQAFDLLNPSVLKISLDMSKIREGKQELVFQNDQVRRPANVSVFNIEPGKIEITAHEMITIYVPVKVRTIGSLSSGLTLHRIITTPQSIEAMTVNNSNKGVEIWTEPINLQDINRTQTFTPKLVVPSSIRFIKNNTPMVQVTIEVGLNNTMTPEKQTRN